MDTTITDKEKRKDLRKIKVKLNLLRGHLDHEKGDLSEFIDYSLPDSKVDELPIVNYTTDDNILDDQETESIKQPSDVYFKTKRPFENYTSLSDFVGKQKVSDKKKR